MRSRRARTRRRSRYSGLVVTTFKHALSTSGQGDAHDLTRAVAEDVRASGVRAGLVTVFVVGSTAAITTIEFEPGAVADSTGSSKSSPPATRSIAITSVGATTTGRATCARPCSGPSLTVPFEDGDMVLGTWQQIMLLEFDTSPRQREIVVQVMGDSSDRQRSK